MSSPNASVKWLEAGYDLFAKEGPGGLQVERLARIVSLNKSGFYHYFGDMENFSQQLIRYHSQRVDHFLVDVALCEKVDPDYLHVLVKHKITVMGQVHLVRSKSNPFFYEAHKELDEKIDRAVLQLWIDHLDIHNNPDLVYQYFGLIRDMFYARVELENLHMEYLRGISDEAKEIVKKIMQEKELKPLVRSNTAQHLNGIV